MLSMLSVLPLEGAVLCSVMAGKGASPRDAASSSSSGTFMLMLVPTSMIRSRPRDESTMREGFITHVVFQTFGSARMCCELYIYMWCTGGSAEQEG